jgi:WD40 repeat protein
MPIDTPFKPFPIAASYELRFTPDGLSLLCVGMKVTRWNLETRKRVGAYRPFAHPSQIDVAPSGTHCIVKSTGGELVLMSLDAKPVMTKVPVREAVEGAAALFSPCGDYVVDAGWDGQLAVRALPTGKVVFKKTFRNRMLLFLACDAKRELYVFHRHSTSQKPVGPADELVLRRWPFDVHPEVAIAGDWDREVAVTPSPDGRRLAAAQRKKLSVVDIASGATLATRMLDDGVSANLAVAWSPDGTLVACVESQQISFFDATTLQRRARHVLEFASDVAFSPDGRLVALGSWGKGMVMAIEDLAPWGEGEAVAGRGDFA